MSGNWGSDRSPHHLCF